MPVAFACNNERVSPKLEQRPRPKQLQFEPVEGGSANDYDYVNGDPIGGLDLDGTCWSIGCHIPGHQGMANFSSGVLNTVTFGNGSKIENLAGVGGNAQHNGLFTTEGGVCENGSSN